MTRRMTLRVNRTVGIQKFPPRPRLSNVSKNGIQSGFDSASGVEEDVEATTNEVSVANHGN
jgi:hypothetical protein